MDDDAPHAFDADAWGASPSWEPEAERSAYEDELDNDELVPLAHSLVTAEAGLD
jgi:hypothetical protein